ncbi:MAG: hypothetical protein K2L31_05680 [Muribaculum sp.]|nr:hypothetical protein [Muribaculum sp.]
MKPGVAVKKMISAFVLFLLMSGMYGGIIALSNRYLREHGMLSLRYVLIAIAVVGFFLIYRWFSRRIDAIDKGDAS